MIRDTFLSIDLDYWTDHYEDNGLMSVLYRVLSMDVPIHCVTYHHDMVTAVNATKGIDRLVNMDYHSDLGDLSPSELNITNFNEGTWINFVNFANRGTYQWIYPDANCYECTGRCDIEFNPFTIRRDRANRICWSRVMHSCGGVDPLKKIDMNRVAAVGISISPDWNTVSNTDDALMILSDRQLVSEKDKKAILRLIASDPHLHYRYEKQKRAISKKAYKKLTHL